MKISTKLTLIISIIIIIIGFIPSYLFYIAGIEQLEKSTAAKLAGMAADALNTTDQMFYERYLDINMLAADPVFTSGHATAKQITDRLLDYKKGHPFYLSLSFFDLNRIRIADTAGLDIGVQHALTEYWPEALAGKNFVTSLSHSESLGEPVLHFAAIVKNREGTSVGLVVSRLSLDSFGEILKKHVEEYRLGNETSIELLDRNGIIIYSNLNKADLFKPQKPDEWEAIKERLTQGANTREFLKNNGKKLLVFDKEQGHLDFKGNDWMLVVEMPEQLAFSSVWDLKDRSRYILIVLAALFFPAVVLFSRTIVKPLIKLRLASAEIGKGNLGVRVEIGSNDEIGELAVSFNQMAVDLHNSNDARNKAEAELKQNLEQQRVLNNQLADAQNHLLQSEKMASLGQLSAGVAHELNNPIGFVYSNMGSLESYLNDIFLISAAYETTEKLIGETIPAFDQVHKLKQEKDYDYIKQDIFQLLAQSKDGLARMRKIVQDLKDFSHVGEEGWKWTDLHKGIDSTLNIVWNELKYKCEVKKEYGVLPEIYCMPPQLNQVFLNLLVNAGHAIETKGIITIRTGTEADKVWVEIADTGKGIPPENIARIFDPFFTTKPVGVGTGLGLSLSYGIVQKHQGRIEVKSEVGKGTTMRVWLPVKPATDGSAPQ